MVSFAGSYYLLKQDKLNQIALNGVGRLRGWRWLPVPLVCVHLYQLLLTTCILRHLGPL